MFCEKCGAPNDDQSRICTQCGAMLGANPPTEMNYNAPAGAPYVAQQPPQQSPEQAPYAAYAPQQQPQQPPAQAPYAAYAPQQPGYGYPSPQFPQQPVAKKKKTGLIIAVVAVLAVALIIGLVLALSGGGGGGVGSKGIAGKWKVVTDAEDGDYAPGLIFNFQRGGKLSFELSDSMPEEAKTAMALMSMLNMTYEVKGDSIDLTMEFFGEKDTTTFQYKIEGNKLYFMEGGKVMTTLERYK